MTTANVMSLVLKRRSATVERRLSNRQPQLATARISPSHATGYFGGYATTTAGMKIHIQDVSRGGVGFICSQRLDPGRSYKLEMGSGWRQAGSGVRVAWCREREGGGGYEGGGQYC